MKRLNNIPKEKAQRILFITVLILVFGVFFISLSLIGPNDGPPDNPPVEKPDPNNPIEDEKPIIETILAPYSENVETIRKFWSLEKDEADQELSIIVTGSNYFMSRGLSYCTEEDSNFNVLASLSGTVKSVSESPLYGKTILIEHDEGLTTEYMSLSVTSVVAGDKVVQGDVIGQAGQNEYDRSASNHVHFRISLDGKFKDPQLLIGKKITEIE